MAQNLQFLVAIRNGWLDAITTAIGTSGFLDIYSGTVPAAASTAIGAQVLLAHLPLSATAAPASSGGVLTFNAITNDSSADNSGTASFFRVTTSGGTCEFQGTVGTSGADLNLVTTTIVATQPVSVTSFTITAPGA
jgi:hypothetical protein